MKHASLAVLCFVAIAPARAATVVQILPIPALDVDGRTEVRFQPFDGQLGTLTGAIFGIRAVFTNALRPELFPRDPMPTDGLITTRFSFNALGIGYNIPLAAVRAPFDSAARVFNVSLTLNESVTLRQSSLINATSGPFVGVNQIIDSSPGIGGTGFFGSEALSGVEILVYEYTPVPEPASLALLGMGLLGLGLRRKSCTG